MSLDSSFVRGVPSAKEGDRLTLALSKYIRDSGMYRKGALAEIKEWFEVRRVAISTGRVFYEIHLTNTNMISRITAQAFLRGFLRGERSVKRTCNPKQKKIKKKA